jgi:hypothetical protein
MDEKNYDNKVSAVSEYEDDKEFMMTTLKQLKSLQFYPSRFDYHIYGKAITMTYSNGHASFNMAVTRIGLYTYEIDYLREDSKSIREVKILLRDFMSN